MLAAESCIVNGGFLRELVAMIRPALISALLSVHSMTIDGQGGSTADKILASSSTVSRSVSFCHISRASSSISKREVGTQSVSMSTKCLSNKRSSVTGVCDRWRLSESWEEPRTMILRHWLMSKMAPTFPFFFDAWTSDQSLTPR